MTASFLPNEPAHRWIEVRDHIGKLLFKYDPFHNWIQIQRGSMVYDLVKLDELRLKHGIKIGTSQDAGLEVVTLVPIDREA